MQTQGEPTPERRPSLAPYVTHPQTTRLLWLSWLAEHEAQALGRAVRRYEEHRKARAVSQ